MRCCYSCVTGTQGNNKTYINAGFCLLGSGLVVVLGCVLGNWCLLVVSRGVKLFTTALKEANAVIHLFVLSHSSFGLRVCCGLLWELIWEWVSFCC